VKIGSVPDPEPEPIILAGADKKGPAPAGDQYITSKNHIHIHIFLM